MQYQEKLTSKGFSSSPSISLSSDFEPFVKDMETLVRDTPYLKAKILEADQQRMALGLAEVVVETAKWAAKKLKNEDLANCHSTKALEIFAMSLEVRTLNDLEIPTKYRKFLTSMDKYSRDRNKVAHKNHGDLARLLMDPHHGEKREQFKELFIMVIGKSIQQAASEKNDVLELFNV